MILKTSGYNLYIIFQDALNWYTIESAYGSCRALYYIYNKKFYHDSLEELTIEKIRDEAMGCRRKMQ